MAKTEKKMKFPLKVVLLLAFVFVMGTMTGATMYATGKAEIAKLSDPVMQMVSHTEYRYGESGQIIARITDNQGNPITVTSCNATILNPDKTYFVNMAGMTASGNISGDFYYNFTTPNGPEGVYEYQATCFYGSNKNASITNSFHLSSAFGSVLGNLTLIQNQVISVNSTLGAQISNLSAQLNTNISSVQQNLANINSTLFTSIVSVNTTINNMNAAMGNNFSQIQQNFTQVLNAISNITVNASVDFSPLYGVLAGNFSVVNTALGQINTTSNNIYSLLQTVNATTNSTYVYITTTLATNIDSALTQLGIINATVNRIETNTQQINSTVNQILQNQNDTVNMQVFSG